MKKALLFTISFLTIINQSKGQEIQGSSPEFPKAQKAQFEENFGQIEGAESSRVRYFLKSNGLIIFLMDH